MENKNGNDANRLLSVGTMIDTVWDWEGVIEIQKQMNSTKDQIKHLPATDGKPPVSGWQDFKTKPANGEEIIVWNVETNQKMFLLWNELYDLIISDNDRWIGRPPACH